MKVVRIALLVIGAIVILGALAIPLINSGMGDIRKLQIATVDLSKVGDGVYTGSYHKGRWTYDVQVAVADHKIASVKNTNARMNALEALNEKVAAAIIAKQSPVIDVVSGATITTRSFQKAVESALEQGVKAR